MGQGLCQIPEWQRDPEPRLTSQPPGLFSAALGTWELRRFSRQMRRKSLCIGQLLLRNQCRLRGWQQPPFL